MMPTPHPRDQVRVILLVLLDMMEYKANLILMIEYAAYLQDRGQEACRVLHCKEERKRGRGGAAYYLSSILQWNTLCTLHPQSCK